MKKSINKVKFLTVALVLSVLVSSCNVASALDDLINSNTGRELINKYRNLAGLLENRNEVEVMNAMGNCDVYIYSSDNTTTHTDSITNENLTCFVGSYEVTNIFNETSYDGRVIKKTNITKETTLGVVKLNSTEDFTHVYMVGNDTSDSPIPNNYLITYNNNGDPLDSKGAVFQENTTNQQATMLFLTVTQNKWCFVKQQDPTKAYVVSSRGQKAFDHDQVNGQVNTFGDDCTADDVFAIARASDPENFDRDCTWVGNEGLSIQCKVNGNTLNVTVLPKGRHAVYKVGDFDAAGSVTLHEGGLPKQISSDQNTTVRFTTNTNSWTIAIETPGTTNSYRFRLGVVITNGAGNFVPNCTWVDSGSIENFRAACMVDGNILTAYEPKSGVTMIVDFGNQTVKRKNIDWEIELLTDYTSITKSLDQKTWTAKSVDGTAEAKFILD